MGLGMDLCTYILLIDALTCPQLGTGLTFKISSNLSTFARGLLSYDAHRAFGRR